jgi:hypothetical protein
MIEIDVEKRVDLAPRCHIHGAEMSLHSGIAHEHIDPAELRERYANKCFEFQPTRYVAWDCQRFATAFPKLRSDLSASRLIVARNDYVGACGSKNLDHRETDSLRRTGDEYDLAFQPKKPLKVHSPFLLNALRDSSQMHFF